MATIDSLVNQFSIMIQRAHAEWNSRNVEHQYLLMEEAQNSYNGTLKAQTDSDQARLDLAMLILSTVAIGPLASLASSAATKAGKHVMDATLHRICNQNMVKTFNVLHFLTQNPVASFAIGKGYDLMLKFAEKGRDGALKTALTSSGSPTVPNGGGASATVFRSQLIMALEAARTKLLDCLLAVARSPLTDGDKGEMLKVLEQSPYFRVYSLKEADRFQAAIELSMYMTYLLNTDYVETIHSVAGSYGGARVGGKARIPDAPSAASYPTGSIVRTSPYTYVEKRVGYDSVGDIVMTRIDQVHDKVFKTPFFLKSEKGFWSSINRDTLRRAEDTLTKVNAFKNTGAFEVIVPVFS
jgi:hypothetical protein